MNFRSVFGTKNGVLKAVLLSWLVEMIDYTELMRDFYKISLVTLGGQ